MTWNAKWRIILALVWSIFTFDLSVLFAEVVSCAKRTLDRMLVIFVSLGFGIVKPHLGPLLHRILLLGAVYFILGSFEVGLRTQKHVGDQSQQLLLAQVSDNEEWFCLVCFSPCRADPGSGYNNLTYCMWLIPNRHSFYFTFSRFRWRWLTLVSVGGYFLPSRQRCALCDFNVTPTICACSAIWPTWSSSPSSPWSFSWFGPFGHIVSSSVSPTGKSFGSTTRSGTFSSP